jgi:hypothetical protein
LPFSFVAALSSVSRVFFSKANMARCLDILLLSNLIKRAFSAAASSAASFSSASFFAFQMAWRSIMVSLRASEAAPASTGVAGGAGLAAIGGGGALGAGAGAGSLQAAANIVAEATNKSAVRFMVFS